ncbi:MAG: hypothetical protein EOO61_20980 [Hymenobacter sp.]|nr:MAG: hypothetical protein EOO61_20980 [Hymenobacter sp.]
MAYSINSPAGKTVQEIIDSLPSLMAVAVVDIQSGMALASLSADGKKFIYLVASSRDTNLAIARDVMRQGAETLN